MGCMFLDLAESEWILMTPISDLCAEDEELNVAGILGGGTSD